MIENLTEQEVKKSTFRIKEFNGINLLYNNEGNSSYIFDFHGNISDILFNPNSDVSLIERHKLNNLIKWNSEITIKVIHLKNTFIYMSTYLDRYNASKNSSDLQYFRYFAEVISYFIISIRDCILQLINSFTGVFIEERNVTLPRLKNKLEGKEDSTSSKILEALNEFEKETKIFREKIRNSFTHRTNPFNGYYKTSLTDKGLEIKIEENKTDVSNDEFYSKCLLTISSLSKYIENLRKIMCC
ncbi:Cthe_2314 family HEPN domain-containing protein [Chishuiella sp.]|uniref:Cthe_2314 family HEPN domain-containing protein n=1 Tax=Chishuiella sp. TaxID=1969467 RepID=UPI0028B2543B|nr:Cthe_2314 family HEPN domain-containing protein [Chishuiella sp.]